MSRLGLLSSSVWTSAENTAPVPAIDPEILDLTRGMVQADEEAYRQFSRMYSNRLYRYLLAVTHGNETAAKELVQQTMIKVARNIRLFQSENEFWNWLAVLARNCATDEHRKRARHWSMLLRFWERNDVTSRSIEENDFACFVALELENLEQNERFLLKRKYIDGVSVRDLATEFEASEKGIESKLSRLRRKLKEAVLKKMKDEQAGEQ